MKLQMSISKILSFTLLCLPFSGFCQIYLDNASFEGEPEDATVPVGWHACAPDTTPDILPGPWGVFEESSEGETYVGLITRSNGTYESIGQRLKATIKREECYQFKLDLARSITYTGYSHPLKLRIWAGATKCRKDQLLLETDFVEHTDWQSYPVQFFAQNTINYLILEAYFSDGDTAVMGNILIDNISPLKKCDRAFLD